MSFNPGIAKQAQEVVFSRKKNGASHPSLSFNNAWVEPQSIQKYFAFFR